SSLALPSFRFLPSSLKSPVLRIDPFSENPTPTTTTFNCLRPSAKLRDPHLSRQGVFTCCAFSPPSPSLCSSAAPFSPQRRIPLFTSRGRVPSRSSRIRQKFASRLYARVNPPTL